MSDITISKADLKARDQKITDQAKRIKELEAGNGGGSGDGDSTTVSASFSKDDQDVLGELAGPIERLLGTALSGVTDKLNPMLNQITDSMSSLQEQVKNQNRSLFSGVASTTLKNYDQVKGSDEFKSLLEKRVPGTNITYGDSWADAEERNSFPEMQEIIDMVQIESGDGGEGNDGSDGSGSNFEPSGGSAVQEQRLTGQYKFKASEYKTKMDAYKSGELDIEAFEKFEDQFNEAVDAGQVLDDLDTE